MKLRFPLPRALGSLALTALTVAAQARTSRSSNDMMPQPRWLLWSQDEAGPWSTTAAPDGDVFATALAALALVSEGYGPLKGDGDKALAKALQWLLQQRDDRGRFGFRADPAWQRMHVVTAYAFAEAARRQRCDGMVSAAMADVLRAALVPVREYVERGRPRPAADYLVWSLLLADSALADERGALPSGEVALAADGDAAALLAEIGRVAIESDESAAAALLREWQRGFPSASAATNGVAAVPAAAAITDPVGALFVAVRHRERRAYEPAVERWLRPLMTADRRVQGGRTWIDERGSSGLDACSYHAVCLITYAHYYRYCKLNTVCLRERWTRQPAPESGR